ncbi:maintenance of mitochondrial morphology protein 1 [Thelephora terrestris]|uniref:Maintenance of mitochondrial morphology protein 1 n=1 Tax=Thelephora terrestris TaxID=56493 RepID=A0A9P6H345_9AGAM|nr:maintenance of mitochondrial morphology protein 1 [Thelephora terrestris]
MTFADHSAPNSCTCSTPMGNYIFTLTPTFTQGLILGQASILLLVYFILKYLFFDSKSTPFLEESTEEGTPFFRPSFSAEKFVSAAFLQTKAKDQGEERDGDSVESAEWLNVLLKQGYEQIVDEYRCKLRATDRGLDGEKEKVALRRIQELANTARPQTLLGPIHIHSVDLGASAPQFSNAKITETIGGIPQVEFDLNYTDTAFISLSTTALFNYPFPGFAKLPLSLIIALELFSCKIVFTPPKPTTSTKQPPVTSEEFPALMISIPPSSISLHLKMTSTMGSRAQLADVPKLHELIETQVKKLISEKATWKVILPGMSKPRPETNADSNDG